MVDEAAVRAAIAAVEDPELHRPFGELDMIEDLVIRSDDSVAVTIALTVPGCPLKDEIVASVVAAAKTVPGVETVDVQLTNMDDAKRAAIVQQLRGGQSAAAGGPGPGTRVITISSGKGGVGKSSITTNTAVALAEAGYVVGVIDADVWGFSIPKMLGVERKPTVLDQLLLAPEAFGVRVMSMDYFVRPDQAVIWRGPMLHKALEQFLSDVHWGDLDFLLIDMPPGTGDVAISISQFVPSSQAIVITTPQPTAQRVAKRAALMAEKVNQEVMGVVENMSWFTGDDGTRYPIFGEGGGAALAEELGVPLLARIPLLIGMRTGADEGVPVQVAAPDSEATAAFRLLAEEIVNRRPRIRTHPELVIS